jgi:antitoxin FitA
MPSCEATKPSRCRQNACMYNAVMVSIQVRDVPEQVRDTLAEVARSRGQSMQAYLLALLEDDARRARNVMLLKQVREMGGGYVAAPGEAAGELDAIRAGRDQRNAGDA